MFDSAFSSSDHRRLVCFLFTVKDFQNITKYRSNVKNYDLLVRRVNKSFSYKLDSP